MDAVKFLEEYNRMCNTYNDCVGCPMHDKPFCHPHDMTTNDERKELVDTVAKWSKEHPIMTNGMGDTINRAAAIDALERIFNRCEEIEAHLPDGDPDKTGYKMFPDCMTIWKYLRQLQSTQPEQKKSKWLPYLPEGLRYKCSECGSRYDIPWRFCPNCGSYNGGGQSD